MDLRYFLINLAGTLLRAFPFPTKTGLIKIGKPGPESPVFLTCNYSLTVERVKKSLKGIDCYLLVANSNGINVWCASTGGHLTNHDVILVLKTTGIENLVSHRRIILPQLAASGIEARVIREKTGWNIIWGPVYARDIKKFLKNGMKKSSEMRQVRFTPTQRIEMAVMWAFPFSVLSGVIFALVWKAMLLPVVLLTWILPFLIFISFPLYMPILSKTKTASFSKYTRIFDFALPTFFIWTFFVFSLAIFTFVNPNFSWATFLRWGVLSLVIILIISIDLMGSTPVYKSSLHSDRFFEITLDGEKCKGEGICIEVCPRNCFELNIEKKKAFIPGVERCVRCGACIVQCPFDALYFKNPMGETIPAQIIRTYKLNLMGDRSIKTN